jgi:ABC-2 type transport system permease protein
LPSPRTPIQWLLAKEWRELWSARAWWVMLAVAGPLVGLSFINAVQLYAELSGLNGTAEGVGPAFSPLVGIWAPTFSAYELIAAFLFPFVVIRVVGADRQSGALKLELQQHLSPLTRIGAKALVLLVAWIVAMLPALIAGILWATYGGSAYAPEIATVVFGHVLNAGLTIALGAAAASVAEHPSTAAIITLAVTVGTWIISFLAALQGGWWEQVAAFTPPALVAQFQHGLIRLDVTLAAIVLVVLGLALAAIWTRLGVPARRRGVESLLTVGAAAAALALCTFARPSWDTSENRQNSFSERDEAALAAITAPLHIEAHFAAEDARRGELERMALSKLRRVMPHLTVDYVARTSVGLYEQNTEHYGEIIYTLGRQQRTSRIVTADGVLETIYGLAGVTPPADDTDEVFRGHPLAVPPRHASLVFYGMWPGAIAAAWFVRYRRHS